MKHIKSIYSILEKQLKLFPDFEKNLPDNPKDVAHKYLKDRETTHSDKSNSINTWYEAEQFMNDIEANDKAKKQAYDDYDQGSMDSMDLDEMYIDDLITNTIIYIDSNVKGTIDRETYLDLYEKVEEISDSDELEEIFEEYKLDWDKFESAMEDVMSEEYINTRLGDGSTEQLSSWVYSNEGILYRAMHIPYKLDDLDNEEITNHKGVGIFWSYERSGAEAHWGSGDKNEIVLVAKVEPEDVNWEKTLYKSYWTSSEELEVELIEGTTIEIIGFEISSHHSHFRDMKDKDEKYFSEVLGLDWNNIRKVTKNIGSYDIVLEEPIIVKT